jgi:hypothetical protein
VSSGGWKRTAAFVLRWTGWAALGAWAVGNGFEVESDWVPVALVGGATALLLSAVVRAGGSASGGVPDDAVPTRGIWHRVGVYVGLRDDDELLAFWDAHDVDPLTRAIGLPLGIAAVVVPFVAVVVLVDGIT